MIMHNRKYLDFYLIHFEVRQDRRAVGYHATAVHKHAWRPCTRLITAATYVLSTVTVGIFLQHLGLYF
jgi:hypothetical protein